ncbi:putative antigen 5/SCP domain-containing protein [Ixodes scapularis]
MSPTGSCVARLLLLSAALVPATLEDAVCRAEYKKVPAGVVHTACKPPNKRCKITESGLSNDHKDEFLKAHNYYRMKVARGELPNFPKAATMPKLIWDDELAEVAQAHADQCTVANRDLRHDNKKGRFTTKFRYVGQNLAWEAASDRDQPMNVTRQVTSWFNEYRDFDPAGIRAFAPRFGKQTGHFTQIIWSETQFLGCGFTQYTLKGDISSAPYQKIYVCNYGPG